MLPRRNDEGAVVYLPTPGGAIFNTAIALGRLGEDVGFFSGMSTDQFGRQLVNSLNESAVDCRYCTSSDRLTALAIVELKDGNASYTFHDQGSAGRMLDKHDLPEFGPDVTALHFGAISLIPEPCGSTYEALMAREAESRVISFDPNIRPGFIPDFEKHRDRMRRMIALSDIVKVSVEDIAWIEPDQNQQTVIESWLGRPTSVVVLTKGAEGATAFSNSGEINVDAELASVVDTVGAGDIFNAGFLSGLKQSGYLAKQSLDAIPTDALEESLRLGRRVAAISVTRAGADPPWKEEIF